MEWLGRLLKIFSVSVVLLLTCLGGDQFHKDIWKPASAFPGGKIVPQQN